MLKNRITYNEAKSYLGFRFDSEFIIWCEENYLIAHNSGTRRFFIKGSFLAVADAEFINELRAHHDDAWIHYYDNYELVRPFLKSRTREELALDKSRYIPKSDIAITFYNKFAS